MLSNETMLYNYEKIKSENIKSVIAEVYETLKENGYDPLSHLSGYILTGDPTYIPRINNSRIKITRFEREEILIEIIDNYINE